MRGDGLLLGVSVLLAVADVVHRQQLLESVLDALLRLGGQSRRQVLLEAGHNDDGALLERPDLGLVL